LHLRLLQSTGSAMLEVAASPSQAGLAPPAPPTPAQQGVSFHDVLSALNPLQYLPVIGTIYRATTGDQIPETVRRIGSIIVSGLMGGPVGAAISIAMMGVEKVTGIDLDQVGQKLLAVTGIGTAGTSTAGISPAGISPTERLAGGAINPAPVQLVGPDAPASPIAAPAAAWSPAQLAAYGVTRSQDGSIKMAGLSGAEVLNSLEWSRIQSAYGRAIGLTG
jgi:hypothetical protein